MSCLTLIYARQLEQVDRLLLSHIDFTIVLERLHGSTMSLLCFQPSGVQISFRLKIVGLNEATIQLSWAVISVVNRGI